MRLRHQSFSPDFFRHNRQRLVSDFTPQDFIFLQSADKYVRNGDQFHTWRQDSSFFYFTGIEYENVKLLIIPSSGAMVEEILFIPRIDAEQERWEGKMLTKGHAQKISGIEKIMYLDQFESVFLKTQRWRENLFCESNDMSLRLPLNSHHHFLSQISRRIPGLRIRKLAPRIAALRMVKNSDEIEAIKKSLDIIDTALRSVMRGIAPGAREFELEARLIYEYTRAGCRRHGFDPIVASGKNATTLHYNANADTLKSGEAVLIDTGGEYAMYSGDITRVYPNDGTFRGKIQHCYETNLEIQETCIAAIKPGLTVGEINDIAGEIQGTILAREKFISDSKQHSQVSYHRVSHLLGLDVHDITHPDLKLLSGAVITVEPGLYLPEEGIGIRIEDNILLTQEGNQNLSAAIPKGIRDIKEIMRDND